MTFTKAAARFGKLGADAPPVKAPTAGEAMKGHALRAVAALTPSPVPLVVFGIATLGVIALARTVRGR